MDFAPSQPPYSDIFWNFDFFKKMSVHILVKKCISKAYVSFKHTKSYVCLILIEKTVEIIEKVATKIWKVINLGDISFFKAILFSYNFSFIALTNMFSMR